MNERPFPGGLSFTPDLRSPRFLSLQPQPLVFSAMQMSDRHGLVTVDTGDEIQYFSTWVADFAAVQRFATVVLAGDGHRREIPGDPR